jgi:hypothetical protein
MLLSARKKQDALVEESKRSSVHFRYMEEKFNMLSLIKYMPLANRNDGNFRFD